MSPMSLLLWHEMVAMHYLLCLASSLATVVRAGRMHNRLKATLQMMKYCFITYMYCLVTSLHVETY